MQNRKLQIRKLNVESKYVIIYSCIVKRTWPLRRIALCSTNYIYTSSGGSPIESAYNAGETVLIPGSGRSPGGGNSNPLQYSCWENPMNRRASWLVGCNLWGCKTSNTTENMHARMHVYIINKIFILIRII